MKRIAFFQEDLGVGGIQKSLLNLLRNLDYSCYEVDLYLFSSENFWDGSIPDEVNIIRMNPVSSVYKFIPFDAALSRLAPVLAEQFPDGVYYDAAIDFNSYQPECAAAAITVPAGRRIEWVHNDVEKKLSEEWKYRILHHFFKGKYKYFDRFVCVSEGIVEPFIRCAGKLSDSASFSVIPNYIDTAEINLKKTEPVEDICIDGSCVNFVTVGRICRQKGYDIMLYSFRKALDIRSAAGLNDNLRLYVIGEGPDKKKLIDLAETLGLSGRAFFIGSRSNPFSYLNAMDAFVSTSRYEGQGINIMEAMAVGLPVYCTKNLEAYVEGLKGYDDIATEIAFAEKKPKNPDSLDDYNCRILRAADELME